jgi:hypothetical protein
LGGLELEPMYSRIRGSVESYTAIDGRPSLISMQSYATIGSKDRQEHGSPVQVTETFVCTKALS